MSARRAEFRAALLEILDDFKAAHPTWIRQTYNAWPASFAPPLAFVSSINEPNVTLEFGNRLNRPSLTAELYLVEGVYENAQTAMRLDEKADALLTYLVTQHDRVSGATLLEPTGGAAEEPLPVADVVYVAARIPVRLNAVD